MTVSSNAKELLATEHRWQGDRLTDGKPLGVFGPLKVRAVVFRSVESIAGRYRVIEDFEKDILKPWKNFSYCQFRDDNLN